MTKIEFCRNIGISAHIDAGKTTVTERILYFSGKNYKLGEVHEGSATMDWMQQEQERGITITSAATTIFWKGAFNNYKKHKINIIDTPGHVDFTIEVERSLRILDGVVLVFCAVGGVQPQSETVWRQASKYNLPKIIFINKMDRIGADFFSVIDKIKYTFKTNILPIHLPIFKKNIFVGIVDILLMKAIYWKDCNFGNDYYISNIPKDMIKISSLYYEKMIEIVSEESDAILSKYLNNEFIDLIDIKNILRKLTIKNKIVLATCGSAFKNKGIQTLIDSIVDFLPNPKEKDITFLNKNNLCQYNKFSSLVFKIVNDVFVGSIVFIRIYTGHLKIGDIIYNPRIKKTNKVTRLFQMHANKKQEIKEAYEGDIVSLVGVKDVITGDTLCDESKPIVLEKINFPEPVISLALISKNKDDQDKLGFVLNKLIKEDPSLKFNVDNDSGQIVLSGMGELHLDIIIDRIKREHNIEVNSGKPNVSYRETIRKKIINIEGKYIKQSGGKGQYGHVIIDLIPLQRGEGYKFINDIKYGIIPNEYISAINKSIKEQLCSGPILGYKVVDIAVRLFDGSFHEVDSSELAFKLAASIAFKKAFKLGDPILLEPIMSVKIETSEMFLGDVIGDLNKKRGNIIKIDDFCGIKLICSEIPLSEMFGYATELRSKTQGRSTYNMEFLKYCEVPEFIFNKIINK